MLLLALALAATACLGDSSASSSTTLRHGPAPGAGASAAAGWPPLVVPRGDSGLRLQLGRRKFVMLGLAPAPKEPPPTPMGSVPFTVLRLENGRVWRLRTDRSGRAQLAVPPGHYDVALGWKSHWTQLWTIHVRAAGTTLTRRIDRVTI